MSFSMFHAAVPGILQTLKALDGILAKAEAAGNADRERISTELKREFGRLIAATTSQVKAG